MNLEVGKIYTLKLNSGEELVGKVHTSIIDGCVSIQNPVSIAPGPKGMGLVPSMFTANPDIPVVINTNSITMYAETDDSVQGKYIEATTGIQVPDKKILVG